MLNAHPQLTVANDTHFIAEILKGFPIDHDPQLSNELVKLTLGYRRFRRLGLEKDAVIDAAENSSTYGQFVCQLYQQLATRAADW